MYKKSFYITEPIGNNEFSFENRENKKLYVPSLIEINDFDDIKLQDDLSNVAFEDFDFDGKLSTNYGLKNYYKIKWNDKFIYLFDNHNHAYYFWYLARSEGIIGDNNILMHMDEHADTRDSGVYLMKPESFDLEKVSYFTNSVLNVGNYIVPAQKEGLIGEVVQIRNETNLVDYLENKIIMYNSEICSEGQNEKKYIFNLDLDFFQPDLDYIDYELKKKVVLDLAKNASIITVSTSPFFINQELAIHVFKDLFGR